MLSKYQILALLATFSIIPSPSDAVARPAAEAPEIRFDINVQSVGKALIAFGIQANVTIGISRTLPDIPGNKLKGRYPVEQGLRRLLEGTGLGFEMVNAGTFRIVVKPQSLNANPVPPNNLSKSDIIVTATKQAVPINEASFSIGVLAGNELARTGMISTNDAALEIAGLTVTNLGPGRNKLFVRGLSDGVLGGRMQSTVAIYFNDARVNYSAPDPDLRLVDIDRLEVLRGPQGMLYSAGTLGGIYRIVPKEPDLSDWSGSVSGEVSNIRHGSAGYRVEGVANAPLAPDQLAVRVAAYREIDGGYIDDPNLGPNVNRTAVTGARGTVRATLADDWFIEAGLVVQDIASRDTHYVTQGLGSLSRANRLAEPHDNDFRQARLALEGTLFGAHLSSTSAFVKHDLSSIYDATSAALALAGQQSMLAGFEERDRIRMFTHETRLASDDEGRFNWLAGFSILNNSDHYQGILTDVASGAALYGQRSRDNVLEIALFAKADLALNHSWTVSAGVRALRYKLSADASRFDAGGMTPTSDRDARGYRLTPLAIIRYQPADTAMVYAQVAQGYRFGGINASTSGVPDPDSPAGRFSPDRLWSAELGTRLTLFDGSLKLSSALFGFRWSDIQSEKLLPSGLTYTANIGRGFNIGIEAEAALRISGRLSIRAGGLLNDPTLKPYPAFAKFDHDLPGISRGSGHVTVRYDVAVNDRWTSSTDVSLNYTGRSRLALTAEHDPPMGDYTLVNIRTGIANEGWSFQLFMDNVFDTRANSFAFGNPFAFSTSDQQTPLQPRTVGIRFSRDF